MRASEAAKSTANMIEESVKHADGGVRITEEVTKILSEILDGSKKVNTLVAEIAVASNEQAKGIEQVNIGVAEMNKVTQQNAASSEESAAAAEELTSQAEELAGLVRSFIVSGNGSSRVARVEKAHPAQFRQIETHGSPAIGPQNKTIGLKGAKDKKGGNGKLPQSLKTGKLVIPFDEAEAFGEF